MGADGRARSDMDAICKRRVEVSMRGEVAEFSVQPNGIRVQLSEIPSMNSSAAPSCLPSAMRGRARERKRLFSHP